MSGIQGQGKSYNWGKGGKVDSMTFKSRRRGTSKMLVKESEDTSEKIRKYLNYTYVRFLGQIEEKHIPYLRMINISYVLID